MGIKGLWEILNAAAQKMSFKQLAIQEGLSDNAQGMMPVGVDACLWLTQCQEVFHKPSHAQMGRNPELRTLFYKLAALIQAGVNAVFVFDGLNRLKIKHNKRVRAQPHWLVTEFREMIELFGFHSYIAPGEAEAELAQLNRLQHISAIFTDDGDVMVFGACRVFRKFRNKKNKDKITVYTSEALQDNSTVELTHGGLVLIALAKGGDYDMVGLSGCGINIAHGLARCGFGDSLLAASQEMEPGPLQEFLIGWRADVQNELATNSRGYLRYKQKDLSMKISNTFPNPHTLALYARPTTSWSEGFFAPNTDSWVVKLPSLPKLALYSHRKFGWSALDITGKFQKYMYTGLHMRRLAMVHPIFYLSMYLIVLPYSLSILISTSMIM
ncbi:PIN domain-like protein [Mycena vulgaris]|nr:PIN domain-like protein [Mycena vulgaris]